MMVNVLSCHGRVPGSLMHTIGGQSLLGMAASDNNRELLFSLHFETGPVETIKLGSEKTNLIPAINSVCLETFILSSLYNFTAHKHECSIFFYFR